MLHLYATGSGGPTVVLDAGYGSGWTDWRLVQPAVAASARVVSYDRANVGESDPGPTPRTSADAVADLHALLQAAGLPAPYVLVGHSYGGTNALLYASTYPEKIAGLVLVDAVHEEYRDRLRELDPEQMAALDQLLATIPEGVDFDATSAQIREAGPLPTVPAVVIARGVGDFPPLAPTAETEQLWQELQRDLANRIPGAELVVAERSGHTVPKDQPEAIVEAIGRVLAAASGSVS